ELVAQRLGRLVHDRRVPTTDKHRRDRTNSRLKPGIDTPFDAAQKRLGGAQILLAGKQEGDVNRDAGKDCLLDRRQAFLSSWNLDEKVGASRARIEILGSSQGAGGVVGQQGRYFQRHPTVHTIRLVIDRLEQVSGTSDVFQS